MALASDAVGFSSSSRNLFVALIAAAAFACAGPAGKQGPPGPPGPGPDGGTDGGGGGGGQVLTAETCMVCHGTGQIADDIPLHRAAAQTGTARNFARITSVSNVGTKPTITFTVSSSPDGDGGIAGLSSFNFTVAQLVPTDADGGNIDNWRPVINRNYLAADAGSISSGGAVEVSANARAATTPAAQLSGILTDNGGESYTYTFGNDLSVQVADGGTLPVFGVVSVPFDPALTTRIGLQTGAPLPGQNPTTLPDGGIIQPVAPFSATIDVFPGGALSTNVFPDGGVQRDDSRAIVNAQSCEQCHHRLTVHGRRINVNYCVTCHNANSFDPGTPANNRQTVDFKRVVHKLHMGKSLPSVKAGQKFLFNGNDFSDVTFPMMSSNGTSDPGNCTACHEVNSAVAGAPADYWKTKPTMVACGSCHDGVDFGSPTGLASCNQTQTDGGTPFPCAHSGGAQTNDSSCVLCHLTGGQAPIEAVHTGLDAVQASFTGKYRYNIISVTNTAPGQNPVITFSVTNPSSGNTAYNLTETPWNQTANGNSRLFFDIAWSTRATPAPANTNYTNEGSGANPGQPVSINALATKVAGGTPGTFTVTSPVAIPANAVGVGEVVMEGHPAEPVGGGTVSSRIPVPSATRTFAITGTATTARRSAVDINKCNACHGNLSLHGNNRTSRIEACVACHNANATDVNQRPKTGTPIDGKAEESIDFKRLIHGIHGTEFSGEGPVIYGFGGSANDFRETRFPGVLQNCEACHNAGTYSATFADALGTTTSTETLADPSTYLRTTRITATCSACHASGLFISHMKQNGGAFDVTQAQIDAAQ